VTADINVGDIVEVTVGRFVPGGHALAFANNRTLFVRHGITGERVRVQITESTRKMARGDVIEVVTPSEFRVPPPCPYAGTCGGCDFQHITLAEQRRIKSEVLGDALRRQAQLPDCAPVLVEPVPGDVDGLRWRTRVTWQRDEAGRRGFFRHRTHTVVPITDCLICQTDASEIPGPFQQVHVGAPKTLTDAVVAAGEPQPGESWWDLFGGTGLFATALRSAGVEQVDLVEADVAAAAEARRISGEGIRVHHAPVKQWLASGEASVDGIVVDPPRSGLGPAIVNQLAAASPRIIVSVSCDPVTFARDLRAFIDVGYAPRLIRAFDAFPMTQHMEIVAALVPSKSVIG
jgi:tRNA/tmRNA/rRNA uracil-C5-methylase (TrmA/RlmC/RlmD family)